MLTAAATRVKNSLGRFFEAAQSEPVLVERSGRASVVILSFSEYERLKAFEDKYWGDLANEAVKEGFATGKESQKWFENMQARLNAAA